MTRKMSSKYCKNCHVHIAIVTNDGVVFLDLKIVLRIRIPLDCLAVSEKSSRSQRREPSRAAHQQKSYIVQAASISTHQEGTLDQQAVLKEVDEYSYLTNENLENDIFA